MKKRNKVASNVERIDKLENSEGISGGAVPPIRVPKIPPFVEY
jgi:hypothetical protein